MSFEVEGKLYKKFDTEKKTETFSAREFVLEVADGNYPQLIKFQLVQDKCALVDSYQEGEILKVHFDLRGREWNDKYFTNLNAWRIEKAGEAVPPPPAGGDDFFPPSPGDEPPKGDGGMDDLPF